MSGQAKTMLVVRDGGGLLVKVTGAWVAIVVIIGRNIIHEC
ncbi:hypothetical protein FKOIJHOC_00104 [Acinetobacter phage Ab_121]|nr:hypothetical protein FKOIJHOC_00104 [Acinetobacter phage Ab_121]